MTITLQAVNELIQSLESAGELSIREQKFQKLAKEFRICSASLDAAIKTGNVLAEQNAQLAAENVQIKAMNDCLSEELRGYESDGAFEGPKMHLLWWQVETPATDRIVAGIKADGVEEFAAYQRAITDEWACKEGHSSLLRVAESAELFAKQLREGKSEEVKS
ncbi:hypothetical protein [Klebsiella grimontii]|uniref:hypothetical protein n=1 Tax=Klebsiella grimontii TaxID=2058152 RepID=UPI0012B9B310|nr:hypothetical protein [Klebsiella grimontii]